MEPISFKERVKNIIISEAKNYKNVYVEYEYLICSSAFTRKKYYIIGAKEDNFQHLTGVNSLINPQEFYKKSIYGTLNENDFDFIKRNQSEKSVKGSVRRKIKVLPDMMNIFSNNFDNQEQFIKNRVICTFATADNNCTIGYKDVEYSIPISLLSGCEINQSTSKPVELVLRKRIFDDKFDEIILGETTELKLYFEYIKEMLSKKMNEIATQNKVD